MLGRFLAVASGIRVSFYSHDARMTKWTVHFQNDKGDFVTFWRLSYSARKRFTAEGRTAYKEGNTYVVRSFKLLIVNNCDLSLVEVKLRKHDHLLSTIAAEFGFDSIESRDLLKHVVADTIRHYTSIQEYGSVRIWLSKLMVRKCISKLSSDIFASTSLRPCSAAAKQTVQDMPLTLRAVFILQHSVGFNELEVAEILNSSVYIVRIRLNKALEFFKIYG